MALRECTFQPEYRSGQDDLVSGFYHPALRHASEYWRAVGYFRSSALEEIGAPLGDFVVSGGTIKLVTSVDLTESDVDAIKCGLDRQAACEFRLMEQLYTEFAEPLGKGAFLLAHLLELGRLEIRIALPTDIRGIYHEKVGIFLDDQADYVAFFGSSNESRQGLVSNYECVDVYPSWTEPERAGLKHDHFARLWEGVASGVTTLGFPEAVKRELLRMARSESRGTAASLVAADERWVHQDKAIAVFLEKKRGVLEMATGTGKTRTALRICRKLLEQREIESMIISTDGNDLLDQWNMQILEFTTKQTERLAIYRAYFVHHEADSFLIHPNYSVMLASRQALPAVLSGLSPAVAAKTILIHDEVHGLGSPGNRAALDGLADNIPYRLGLSATPEREYDQEGTDFITKHIGPVIMSFGLEDAIRKGILAPFDYFPLDYTPDDDDKQRVAQIRRRYEAKKLTADPMPVEQLWTEIAAVYKTSKAKIPIFTNFIAQHADLLKRCIIFVETRDYGTEVLPIVHLYRHDFHEYYAENDQAVLRSFAKGDIECVITCHRLSQGIDIKSLETVILFSSARARLEMIQRIGRCLRVDPNSPRKRANVVDFIRRSDDLSGLPNGDEERREWLTAVSLLRGPRGANNA